MAWQHRPYWASPPAGRGTGGGHDPASHTLLGTRTIVNGSRPLRLWQTYLDFDCRPYPGTHPVRGVEIVPAAVLLGTLLRAADGASDTAALRDVELRIPLAVTEPRLVQVVLDEGNLRLSSRLADGNGGAVGDDGHDEQEWLAHTIATADGTAARGRVARQARIARQAPAAKSPAYPSSAAESDAGEWRQLDAQLRGRGVGGYGFEWRVGEFRLGDGELGCVLSTAPASPTRSWAPLLDGALTVASALLPGDDLLRMPARIGQVTVCGEPPQRARLSVRTGQDGAAMDLQVTGDSGEAVVRGLVFGLLEGAPGAAAPPQRLVHELTWRPFTPGDGPAPLPEPVVFLGDDDGYLDLLERAGVRCLRADTPEEAAAMNPGLVLIAAPPSSEPVERAAEHNTWSLIRAAQVLAGLPEPPRLCCLTRAGDLGHAPLRGAGRIIAGEHPDLWGGLLEVSAVPSGERLACLLADTRGEDVIAVTAAGDLVARLTPVERAPERPPMNCRPDSTYLITGGLGALGLAVARWLTDRGARRLVLAGRRGLPPRRDWDSVADPVLLGQIEAVRGLEKLGTTVRVVALDIGDAERAAAALDPAALGLPPIRGVVHAAGVTRDMLLARTGRSALADAMRPKAGGAMVLHRLFPPGTLDFFVMFSSCGQFARVTGQAGYAAANAFLDALAANRGDAISFGWMAWHGMGMSGANQAGMAEANARGLDAVSPDEAFRAWQFAERFDSPYFAIARVLPVPRTLPVLAEMLVTDDEAGPVDGASPDALDGMTAEDLVDDLRAQVAAELRMNAGDVNPRRPLPEMGVDSVLLVTLRARLLRRYGVDLPPTILWNQPTISALAAYLDDQRVRETP